MFLLSQKRRGKLFQREVCGNFAMFCDPSGPFSVCWPKLDAVCGEGGNGERVPWHTKGFPSAIVLGRRTKTITVPEFPHKFS